MLAIAFVAAEPEAKPDVIVAAEPVTSYVGTSYHGNLVYPSAYSSASYVASPYAYTSRYAYASPYAYAPILYR